MKWLGGLVLVGLLAGCGGGEADIPLIEDEIKQQFSNQTDVDVTVDCPDSIAWKVGDDFHCFAEAEGESTRVTVHMENEDGEWSWIVG